MKIGLFSRKRAGQSKRTRAAKGRPEPSEAAQLTGEERSIETLSSNSEHMQVGASAQVDPVREPRDKRVAELREQVRSGTYEIPLAPLIRILAARIFKGR